MLLRIKNSSVLLRIQNNKKKYLDPVLQLLARLREYKYVPFTCKGLCASEDKKKYFGLVLLRV